VWSAPIPKGRAISVFLYVKRKRKLDLGEAKRYQHQFDTARTCNADNHPYRQSFEILNGLARAGMAVTVYDTVDTSNSNFQNMSLTDQNRLLQTGQMSGSFIPSERIQQQQENVKSYLDYE
jgi:hypothetical protein